MLSYTAHYLDKLETLLKDLGYKIRYEKGNFKTGACKLLSSKIIVVNKFSNLEVKIQALSELVQEIDADQSSLTEKQRAFYLSVKQTNLTF
ncbi:hypothetical protein [Sphingobacterium hungaricum]|uniref:Uncharacterized protein n=1 Tax=Sphingobacterium hungaricum TaxID=2082723 RepID=A0A928UV37_9SPHI|nr:hypothetical protein [Sphingobacterium hungaricum]MBE8712413.1 hypothetical protein [Sphingobacterium hungaricum]